MHSRQEKLEALNRVLDVLEELREKCPWDKKQTNESLRPNTIEEVYELCDALMQSDDKEICKELGNKLCDKLIFRHPHVYPPADVEAAGARQGIKVETAADVSAQWEQLKQKEKDGNETVLSGVPQSLPTLIKAYRIQDKARNVGFDWEERAQVWDKVKEEIGEFEAELANMDQDKAEAEFGDVLFSLINAARLYKINPDNALERTNQKFIRRFNYLESKTLKQGRALTDMTLAEMDAIWDEAKQKERES